MSETNITPAETRFVGKCQRCNHTTNRRRLVQLAKVFAAFESTHECGARCINATGPSCECTCRGKNHGRHS